MASLFDNLALNESLKEDLAPGAVLLRGFALREEAAVLGALNDVVAKAPFRHMVTPGGYRMSVAMTNCGSLGWITDRTGYRYDAIDPESGKHWPPMPDSFLKLAVDAAREAGFQRFEPDACLINRYEIGARLSLHQDKDERDYDQPTFRCRSASPQYSCSADQPVVTRRNEFMSSTAMWWFGAAPPDFVITASCHSSKVCISRWANIE